MENDYAKILAAYILAKIGDAATVATFTADEVVMALNIARDRFVIEMSKNAVNN